MKGAETQAARLFHLGSPFTYARCKATAKESAVTNVWPFSCVFSFPPRTLEGEVRRLHGSVFQSENCSHQEKGRTHPDPTPGSFCGQRRGADLPGLPLWGQCELAAPAPQWVYCVTNFSPSGTLDQGSWQLCPDNRVWGFFYKCCSRQRLEFELYLHHCG